MRRGTAISLGLAIALATSGGAMAGHAHAPVALAQAIQRVSSHRPPVALPRDDAVADPRTAPLLPAAARAGDLVFRQGTERLSDAVMGVDGGPFTHVGMLIGSPGNWKIIHATPPEVDGRAAGVVIDDLAFYLDPERSRLHAVYGVTALPDQRSAAVTAAIARIGDPFRLGDPSGTYCTELIWGAWKKAGVDLGVKFTDLALPLLDGRYLLPGDLAASTTLRWLGGSGTAKATDAAS